MAGATTISNVTNATNLDGLLRDVYLPYLIDNTFNDASFTALIKPRADIIPGGGNRIVNTFLTQRAEGVGTISEGGNWVTSVPVKGQQGYENVKYLNAYFELTGPVIKAANAGVKSAVDIVTKTVRTNAIAFKNNMERMLVGANNGTLATISNVDNVAGSGYVTVTGLGHRASQFLPVGTRISIITRPSNTITKAVDMTSANNQIGYVNRVVDDLTNRTADIYIKTTASGNADIDTAGDSDPAVGDFIVRDTAFGTITANTTVLTDSQEIHGLQNLISDGSTNSETTTNFLTNWGQTRTSYTDLQSYVKDISDELDEDVLGDILIDLRFARQATPDLLMVTPKAEKKYVAALRGDRRFNTMAASSEPLSISGGYNGNSITLDNQTLRLTSLGSCPKAFMFIINTGDFAFAQNAPLTWVLGDGGNTIIQSHSGDVKFASAVQYMNFVCLNPYPQFKGYNVTEV